MYYILTHPGLQSILGRELGGVELTELTPEMFFSKQGSTSLRSAHRISKAIGHFPFSVCVDTLLCQLKEYDYSHIESPFRVTVKRHMRGNLPFKTVDLERGLVSHIEEKYSKEFSLRDYVGNIRVDLFPNLVTVGRALHIEPLTRRHDKIYNFTNAIKSNIAFAMTTLGEMEKRSGDLIVDLFCGSGTLGLEASLTSPENRFLMIDRNESAIEGVSKNFEKLRPKHSWSVLQGDALSLSELIDEKVDLILADPPFGRHMGKKIKFSRFFGYLLGQVRKTLKPGGLFVVRVMKGESFQKAVAQINGLDIEEILSVDQGGFSSQIFKIRNNNPSQEQEKSKKE